MKYLLLAILILTSCFMDSTTNVDVKKEHIKIPDLIYFGDPRTDLCFAHFYEDAGPKHKVGGLAHSTVPCSVKVCALLENRAEMKICAEVK